MRKVCEKNRGTGTTTMACLQGTDTTIVPTSEHGAIEVDEKRRNELNL